MTKRGPLKPRKLIQALLRAGFYEVHRRGSHVILKHPVSMKRISIPFHGGRDIPNPLVRKILREAGLNEASLDKLL
jgi:predicted RNA binding protein YcfA (HicA-like mRNA interferase family)